MLGARESGFRPTYGLLKAFRKRLQDAGKPVNVAVTACARKLLTILNAMCKNGQDFQKQAA